MKQLLYILLGITLFTSCSSEDDNEPIQTDTSFIVTIDATPEFPNCIAAYKKDGKYYKLGDLGTLTKGKYSPEVKVTDTSISEIYIFSDYMNIIRFDAVYSLEKDKKNSIIVQNGTGGIKVTDKTDQAQYPQ